MEKEKMQSKLLISVIIICILAGFLAAMTGSVNAFFVIVVLECVSIIAISVLIFKNEQRKNARIDSTGLFSTKRKIVTYLAKNILAAISIIFIFWLVWLLYAITVYGIEGLIAG